MTAATIQRPDDGQVKVGDILSVEGPSVWFPFNHYLYEVASVEPGCIRLKFASKDEIAKANERLANERVEGGGR